MNEVICYQNRELSWLKFNERVLEEAEDQSIPLCERLSFLSIYQSNLDEFFMVRIGSLHDMMLLKEEERENKTNMTAREQIAALLQRIHVLADRRDQAYEDVMVQVAEQGSRLIRFASLSEEEAKYLERYFVGEIQPLLSTIIVGRKQPFPFLRNRGIYAVGSDAFERLIAIPSRPGSFMLAEDLILHFLPKVFKKYRIIEKSLIRVTRNADIDADSIYDEDLNYRDHMAEVVKLRRKLCPVRLEMTRELNGRIIERLCQVLGLKEEQVFLTGAPMDLSFLSQIQDSLRRKPELFFRKRVPQRSAMIRYGEPVIPQILEKDILLSYPYESIKPFLSMLHEAAFDPKVVSIRMTLYRLAKDSKVVEALVEAAENGKQVDVLVELKARFDEENNIEWSRRLEDAGCHVIYGLDGLKVHSKLCLITRKEEGRIEYITQIGTGNYNEKTARLYTDLSLMTANPKIGREAAQVFQALSLGDVVEKTEHLLVAPRCLQNRILEMIDEEIREAKEGREAYIGVKKRA